MVDPQFTPWEVRSNIDRSGNHTCYDICLPCAEGESGVAVVASVFADQANARLIAAAPKMHAALTAFEQQWNACGGNSHFGGLFQNVRDVVVEALAEADANHWINTSREQLAKARGDA